MPTACEPGPLASGGQGAWSPERPTVLQERVLGKDRQQEGVGGKGLRGEHTRVHGPLRFAHSNNEQPVDPGRRFGGPHRLLAEVVDKADAGVLVQACAATGV